MTHMLNLAIHFLLHRLCTSNGTVTTTKASIERGGYKIQVASNQNDPKISKVIEILLRSMLWMLMLMIQSKDGGGGFYHYQQEQLDISPAVILMPSLKLSRGRMIAHRLITSTAGVVRKPLVLPKNNCLRASRRSRACSPASFRHGKITAESNGYHQESPFVGWNGVAAGVVALALVSSLVSSPLLATCETPFRVKQEYDIVKLLGEGAYGRVFLAKRKSDGRTVALKAIARDAISNDELQREVLGLQILSKNGGHPHVCQLYGLHDDGVKFYYLALELISGGELFEHLIRNGPYSEAQAAVFLRQFAEAMSFMHSKGVVHADLKPENLMMSSEQDEEALLKVVDFGCAVMQNDRSAADCSAESKEEEKEVMGTTAYMAPEMFQDGFKQPTEASDTWAIGCILYILVTGTHPFDLDGLSTDVEVANNIQLFKNGQFAIVDERTEGLTDSCIDVMKALLEPDPQQRMTSDEFLRHPWVQGLSASWTTMTDSDRKLEAYWQKRFRVEIMRKYAKASSRSGDLTLSDENLHDIFCSMDLDGNGTLEPNEIKVALSGLGVKDSDIVDIVRSIDLDGNGSVDWDEFRTIMRKQFEDGPGVKVHHRQQRFRTKILQRFSDDSSAGSEEQKLKKMFKAIDLDGNSVLDPHEIRIVLRSVGVDEKDISEIVASIDLDRSGGVDWEEFQAIMNEKVSA